MSKSYVFYLHGISCSNCSTVIESYLRKNAVALEKVTIDVTGTDFKKTTITLCDTDTHSGEQLKKLMEPIGYTCKPEKATWIQKLINSHWFLGGLGCSAGIALLLSSLLISGLSLPALLSIATFSTILTLALGSSSWKKLIYAPALTMDTLFAISTTTILIISIASFFVPWLPMMFEASLLIYGFHHIGIAIENTIKEKISLDQFKDLAPKMVSLWTLDGLKKIPLHEIKVADIISIESGVIPLDGVALEPSKIYDTIISGSTKARSINTGELILAGMELAKHSVPLKIEVTKTAAESYLNCMDADIEQSLQEETTKPTSLELQIAKILKYFIPTIIISAFISGIIISFFFSPALAIQCAVSVLVSACPCTVALVVPLAEEAAVQKARKNGVYFKSAHALQQADQIDTVVFDLNGTLTTTTPSVENYNLLPNAGLDSNQLLNICYTLEDGTEHRIGQAIHSYAEKNRAKKIPIIKPVTPYRTGIEGTIEEKRYIIGDADFMKEQGAHSATITSIEQSIDLKEANITFVAHEKTLIGYFVIMNKLQEDAREVIQELKTHKEVHLCTGSNEKIAQKYATLLGIEHVSAGCTSKPLSAKNQSKTAYIENLKKQGKKVCMIGDAPNDVPAFKKSNFSIAVHNANKLSKKSAGAIIRTKNLLPILAAFTVAQQTVRHIKQNLLLSFCYNVGSVLLAGGALLAIGVSLPPAVGVIFMALQACTILLNVYRFKLQPLKQSQMLDNPAELTNTASSYKKMEKPMPKNDVTLLKSSPSPVTSVNNNHVNPSHLPRHLEHLPRHLEQVPRHLEHSERSPCCGIMQHDLGAPH